MKINDQIFKEFKKSKKWKEIFDFKSLEANVALISALLSILLFNLILNTATIDDINTISRTLTKDVGIAILGLLGFLITGLAILLSSITPTVVSNIKKVNRDNTLNTIFLGFYFEGLLIGFTILLLITTYLITYINWSINNNLFLLFSFILVYLVIFILFYSISLIGNCISIFRIVNTFNDFNISANSLSNKDKSLFNQIKLIVLEQILIIESNDMTHKERFDKFLYLLKNNIIYFSENEDQKQRLLNYFSIVYEKNKNT